MYSALGAIGGGGGLNYEQRSCLVCNTPYFCNLSQAHSASALGLSSHQRQQVDCSGHPQVPQTTFCKVFQIDDGVTTNRTTSAGGSGSNNNDRFQMLHDESSTVTTSIHNPFCHSCSLKIQNLHQLQTQCELLQTQIIAIRDELGYCLTNTFPSTNLSDPNYALKLKVFHKWSFKYLPQQRPTSSSSSTHVNLVQHSSHSNQHHQPVTNAAKQSHLIQSPYQPYPSSSHPPPAHINATTPFTTGFPLHQVHPNLNTPAPSSASLLNAFQAQESCSVETQSAVDDERNSVSSSTGVDDGDSRDNCTRYFPLVTSNSKSHTRPPDLQGATQEAEKSSKRRKEPMVMDSKRADGEHIEHEPEQCFICGKMLTNDYLRKNHMQTHSDLRPYKCSMCDKSFANANYKKMHEKTHDKSRLQGEPKLSCSKCGRKYYLQKGLYKHLRYSPTCGTTTLVDHGKVRCQCELCGREFNSRYRLGVHVRGVHKKLRPVSCSICGRPCVDNQQRKKHELTHNPSPSKRFALTCPACPPEACTEYERKRDLERHYANEHPNEEVPNIRRPTRHPRKFRCDACPESVHATFTEKRALDYHMEKYHIPRPDEGRPVTDKEIEPLLNRNKKAKRRRDQPPQSQKPSTKKQPQQNKYKSSRTFRTEPERHSRRISEKYRTMRSIRYTEDDDDDARIPRIKDSNSKSNDVYADEVEDDRKDFEFDVDDLNSLCAEHEHEDDADDHHGSILQSARDYLQIKLEPPENEITIECQIGQAREQD